MLCLHQPFLTNITVLHRVQRLVLLVRVLEDDVCVSAIRRVFCQYQTMVHVADHFPAAADAAEPGPHRLGRFLRSAKKAALQYSKAL